MTRGCALLACAALLAGCGGGDEAPPSTPGAPAGEAPQAAGAQAETPIAKLAVTIYFPSASAEALIGETREIFETASPGDRAKQIVGDLLSGPTGAEALPALPEGTTLRQLYVLDDGIAYADFSSELVSGFPGGSTSELLAVYSLVNSIGLNVPEIRRVGVLVDGRPLETLAGHMDLRRPLAPDRSLLPVPADAAPAAPPPS